MAITEMHLVKPETIEWLWPGRIPFGMLTVLDGNPGVGKSTIMLDLAARLSRGRQLPGGTRHDPCGTVLVMTEDPNASVIYPRLENHGADMRRIANVDYMEDERGTQLLPTIPDDLAEIHRAIILKDARLVVIDPIMSYIGGGLDANRDQDVRRALAPLAGLAQETGAAIVILRHLTKTAGGAALYRGQGSIGFIGIARAGLICADDPDKPEQKVLAQTKTNLGPPVASLAYRITGCPNGASMIVWEGVSAHTAQDIVSGTTSEDRSELGEAKRFLVDVLRAGPRRSTEVIDLAKGAGIAQRTLARARADLKVATVKSAQHNGAFVMALPQADTPTPTTTVGGLPNVPVATTTTLRGTCPGCQAPTLVIEGQPMLCDRCRTSPIVAPDPWEHEEV